MTQLNPNEPNPANSTGDEEPKTMSLLSGVAKGDDLTEAERLELEGGTAGSRGPMGQGAILIALVVLIAGGVLYGMRLAQGELTDGANQQIETRIEETLSRLSQPDTMRDNDPLAEQNLQALFDDTDAIVAMFAADRTASQVPIDYVQKNPFTLYSPAITPEETVEEDAGADEEALRAARRVELEREIQNMQLQSVMGGRKPVAIIDSEFLRVGHTIGSFTVEQISSDDLTVVLEHEGERFTLSMKDR
ncbi:MAG: hypothetical protein WD534_06030 [Phycisphaeraceae bacterium]